MKQEQLDFLNVRHFPGVMSREETAWRCGFSTVEIDILCAAGKLIPLGKPKKNAKRVFATVDIERCIHDMDWMHRAQRTIIEFWERKNRSRRCFTERSADQNTNSLRQTGDQRSSILGNSLQSRAVAPQTTRSTQRD